MKAITFLEWFNDYRVGKIQVTDYDLSLINRVSTFLMSNFKPEMITELFEGWGKDNSDERFTYQFSKLDNSVTIKMPNRVDVANGDFIDYDNMGGESGFLYPQTLNDFISDCNRAGIELTFKPEIANKYFEVNNG